MQPNTRSSEPGEGQPPEKASTEVGGSLHTPDMGSYTNGVIHRVCALVMVAFRGPSVQVPLLNGVP